MSWSDDCQQTADTKLTVNREKMLLLLMLFATVDPDVRSKNFVHLWSLFKSGHVISTKLQEPMDVANY